MHIQLQDTFSTHREDLIRWFTKLTHDPQAADDLAQETLVEAWKNHHKLIDPTGVKPWLNAIGVNVYKRWCRQQGREQRQTDLAEDIPGAASVELELERSELVSLLDSALDLLPPETQALLTARYLEGMPYAKLARTLGVTENVVAVRLHRGKLMLRELLDVDQSSDTWQSTRLWCFTCGRTMYESKFNSETGELHLRCRHCVPHPSVTTWSHTELPDKPELRGLKSFKSALNRLMKSHHAYFRPALALPKSPCENCGTAVDLHREMPPELARYTNNWQGVYYRCGHCGRLSYTALSGIAMSTPEGLRFRREHPRAYLRPVRTIEHEGRDALVLTWQSLHSAHELAVIFAQDTYELLSIRGDVAHE